MTTQTWLANTTGKTEAAAGTAVTLRAAQSGSSKKLTVNSGLISFLQTPAALTMSGYSLTGSQATSLLDMAGTWNTSGNPTALKLNITNTNSGASSNLLDLQVGGVSQFAVSKAGAVTAVGVAIPTISSADTLTNKTLSSPTLSGTVAGASTFSGAQTFTSASPQITLNPASGPQGILLKESASNRWAFGTAAGTGTGTNLEFYNYAIGANELVIASATGVANFRVAPTANSVAIPTISSTDTLSNKTLSSPTLSGTVAGAVSWSGVQTFAITSVGAQTAPIIVRNASSTASTAVAIQLNPSTAGTRFAEIASTNDGGNNTPIILRPGAGGSLLDALTLNHSGAHVCSGSIAATSFLTALSGTAIPAGGTQGAGLKVSSTADFGVFFGSGAPTLSAAKGSLYLRSDGDATNNRAYINTDGSTTWTALTTAA